MRVRIFLKVERILHGLIRLDEIIVGLEQVQIIDLAKLLLPDHLVVVKGALLLICSQVQVEKRLNALHKLRQGVHAEIGRRFMHSFIIAVVFVLICRISSRVYCLGLNRSKQKI